jgi:hypothetical protein
VPKYNHPNQKRPKELHIIHIQPSFQMDYLRNLYLDIFEHILKRPDVWNFFDNITSHGRTNTFYRAKNDSSANFRNFLFLQK